MTRSLLLRLGVSLGLLLLAFGVQFGMRASLAGGERPTGPAAADTTVEAEPAVRAPAIGFRDAGHLAEHFHKHGGEFGAITQTEYLRRAQVLRDRPVGGDILESVREDGVITRFDRREGDFIAVDRDGVIRTFFRPNDGEAYYQRQLKRGHGTP